MTGILDGMRIIEGSAFVAAPLGGMTMAQLGAEVIRFDPIGGGLDRTRWPITADGQSLFWAGLNKGKRSIQVDLGSEEGRAIAAALITAPGPEAGLFLTNFPARGFLDYDALAAERPDLIMVNVVGNHDGSSAVDYTVNPATGFAWSTGPRNLSVPFNHLLPAWDAITGILSTTSLLAAERLRARTGEGRLVRIALSDVAFWMVGNLGKIAEVQVNRHERLKDGNYLYGAFGRDFLTRDGRRVMIVALTLRQWRNLVKATGLSDAFDSIAKHMDVDLDEEGGRFAAREVIGATLKPWVLRAHAGGARGAVRPPRRVLGPVSDLHAAGHRGPALLVRESDVRGGRAAGDRQLPHARVAARVLRPRAASARACSAARRAHRGSACGGARDERRRDRAAARSRRGGRAHAGPGVRRRRVRLHVLSDLHVDFAPFEPAQLDVDAVVLAGDIALGTKGVELASARWWGRSPPTWGR